MNAKITIEIQVENLPATPEELEVVARALASGAQKGVRPERLPKVISLRAIATEVFDYTP